MSREEQTTTQETMRRRLVHFYYAALTMKHLPDHFDALKNYKSMLRAKVFRDAGAPWEGDSITLKYAIIQAYQNWPMYLDKGHLQNVLSFQSTTRRWKFSSALMITTSNRRSCKN